MAILPRSRKQPKVNRRAVLAGSPVQQPEPAAEVVEDKPKKRAARKRAPKSEVNDE